MKMAFRRSVHRHINFQVALEELQGAGHTFSTTGSETELRAHSQNAWRTARCDPSVALPRKHARIVSRHDSWFIRLFSASLFCVVLLPGLAHAGQIITLEAAISIALERYVPLLQAQNAAQMSDVAVSAAQMEFFPSLSLGALGAKSYGRYYSSIEANFIDHTTESLTLSAKSGISLFSGFRDVASLRQAKFDRQASHLDLSRVRETAIFTTVSNFLALILQQDQLQVQRDNLAAEVSLEEQIRQYVTAGTRASADLYQQQANVASARLRLIQAENSAELSKVDLLRTLQLSALETYEFQGPALDEIFLDESTNLEDLVRRAQAQRTDLQAEEAHLKALEQKVRVASSGYWPTVSVAAGYGSDYSSALSQTLHDQLDAYRNGSVSLNISVPIFDNGVTRSAVRRAKLEVQNGRITFDSKWREVELQAKSVFLDYHAAREELTAAQAQEHTAQLAAQSVQERFKAGTAILVEVSQERTSYMLAQSALATARYNLALQSTLMKYYSGELSQNLQ